MYILSLISERDDKLKFQQMHPKVFKSVDEVRSHLEHDLPHIYSKIEVYKVGEELELVDTFKQRERSFPSAMSVYGRETKELVSVFTHEAVYREPTTAQSNEELHLIEGYHKQSFYYKNGRYYRAYRNRDYYDDGYDCCCSFNYIEAYSNINSGPTPRTGWGFENLR